MNKQYIPANVAVMMRTRGYKGEMPVGYHEAQMWLLEKYGAWLITMPMILDVIGDKDLEEDRLVWSLEARDTNAQMDSDGYCEYFDIHDDFQPRPELDEAGIKALMVCRYSTPRYATHDDAIVAGLIKVMKLLDE